jgi:hypothetical protein
MKRARNLLASLALLGSATLGLAGCAAAADSNVTVAGSYYGPDWACTESYPDYCGGYWGGWGWGGDHWWRDDRFHHINHIHGFNGFDHGGIHRFGHAGAGFTHGGGFGHGGGGHGR